MLRYNFCRTENGHIRIKVDVENGTIMNIRITGNFFMIPEDSLWMLERHLNGVLLERNALKKAIGIFYILGIETPMLTRDEIVNAILGAKDEASFN